MTTGGPATAQEIDDAVASHGHLISADPAADPTLSGINELDEFESFPADWSGCPGPLPGEPEANSPADRGWGEGWPSCSGAAGDVSTVTVTRPDGTVGAKVTVRRGIAQLVWLLLDQCQRRGYLLRPEQCGGYVCRPIKGTRIPSNHSWGLAIDVNWLQNPQRRPLTTDIPDWMVQLWERYGFIWGGRWGGATVPDPMHFEASGTPDQMARLTALAIRELGLLSPMPWPGWMPPGHYFGLITGPEQSHGGYYDREKPYVRLIQQAMIRFGYVPGVSDPTSPWADGVFEQPTADAVTAWQRDHMPGTTYYGQVWPDDWAEMIRELQA